MSNQRLTEAPGHYSRNYGWISPDYATTDQLTGGTSTSIEAGSGIVVTPDPIVKERVIALESGVITAQQYDFPHSFTFDTHGRATDVQTDFLTGAVSQWFGPSVDNQAESGQKTTDGKNRILQSNA
jgi:hypothetical protein